MFSVLNGFVYFVLLLSSKQRKEMKIFFWVALVCKREHIDKFITNWWKYFLKRL